jgi:hypothetical protein
MNHSAIRPALLLLTLATTSALAQTQPSLAFTRAQHLQRGINVSHWFSQSANDYSAHHTATETDDADIALIASMGFDNIRLSIDATPLEQQPLDAAGLNADFVGRLDHALDTMLADGLAVQVDLHPEEPYKMQLRTSDAAVDRLTALWRKLAAHYANRNPDLVFFEVMNEPEENDPYRWAGIQARVAAAIREAAPHNTIIATGPNFSDIADLLTQHPLSDSNVIYNFHFYDPHEFTHQGASWGTSWWRFTHGIPYPATEAAMPQILQQVPDPASRYSLERYFLDHWDAHRIRLTIDEAAAWGQANHVPLLCNEFGVFREKSDPGSRNAWIRDVRTALESDHIGWAMWDYHGGFGVVLNRSGEPGQPDPATLEALGLKRN